MYKRKGCIETLESLAHMGHPLGVKEISRNVGLSGSTLYRYLNNLTQLELVEYEPSSRKYHLGIKLVRLGHLATRQLEIHRQVYPIMEELTQKTGDSVILTVRRGMEGMVVEFVENDRRGIKFAMNRGDLLPLPCCAITRPLMAFLPEEEIDRILRANRPKRLTNYTITDLRKIKQELRRVRRRGYAISSQELTLGARGLGAPIRDYSGEVIAVLGLVGPIHNFSRGKLPHLLEVLLAATEQCSQRMGSRVGP
jgi:DNA-binding IclR family transcriptional regulator